MGNLAFDIHDSNGYSVLQAGEFPQASACFWTVRLVEPCYAYVYVHIAVPLQEIPYSIAARRAGAPGQVPGDVTEIGTSQLKDFLQEVHFRMAIVVIVIVISDPVYPTRFTITPPQVA